MLSSTLCPVSDTRESSNKQRTYRPGANRQPWQGALISVDKHSEELTYFVHEVGGQRYGGWFRKSGDSIEVLAQGTIRVKPLDGVSPDTKARSILEEIVKTQEAIRAARKRE